LAQRHQDPAHQQDWQIAHRQAAQYWTESVARIGNLSDALKALEAYYHYIAIQDFAAAARVILHSRDNQWQQFLPLGSTLYRLGLIQPIAEAITTVLDHLPPDNADASELYNILGDLRWIQGRLPDAIACQQSAITLAQASLNQDNPAPDSHRWYYLTMLLVDSQLSLGLYHLDLWELDTAARWFTQVIQRATGTRHQPWADKATTCLALVLSYQGQRDEAKFLATAVTPTVMGQGDSGRYAFFVQLLGHTYLNLDDLAMAETLFQTAIAAAEAGHYLQIQANALSGLGRLQTRLGNFAAAVTRHQTAIALLEEVGAKCDLATAHVHLALTLTQAARQTGLAMDHVRHHQQMAETLFAAIPAPQQVARIQPTLSQIGLCP
jgi:tetratricopeptide (TPR) repeat protein